MTRFIAALLLTGLMCVSSRADDSDLDSGWSESVDNLRARLHIEPQKGTPHMKVSIELQNMASAIKMRFNDDKMTVQITDEKGAPLKKATGDYSALVPHWEDLYLPSDSTLKFRVNFPGLSYMPGQVHTIVDLGADSSWIIPDSGTYYISAVIEIPNNRDAESAGFWHGKLILPKIPIPINKR